MERMRSEIPPDLTMTNITGEEPLSRDEHTSGGHQERYLLKSSSIAIAFCALYSCYFAAGNTFRSATPYEGYSHSCMRQAIPQIAVSSIFFRVACVISQYAIC